MRLLSLLMPRLLRCWLKGFDVYLLRYPVGSEIPTHVDEVLGFRHYRCNIILRQARQGGDFFADEWVLNTKCIKVFASDSPHMVSRIEAGTRIVLSIGVCLGR
jgi:hypothetical protein